MLTIKQFASFEEAKSEWQDIENATFLYPFQSWWYNNLFAKHFSSQENILILGVYENSPTSHKENSLAIGAFEVINNTITFLGTKDVSKDKELVQDITDFGDIAYAESGKHQAAEIWHALLTYFTKAKFTQCNFTYVRQDSPTYSALQASTHPEQVETSPYVTLPKTWDEYLATLERKERHELRRKIKRLEQDTAFHLCKDQTIGEDFHEFIRLHKLSDPHKAKFMTEDMEKFFWDLVTCEKNNWQIHFCSLFREHRQVASVMAFMNDSHTLLYNSGFDPVYSYYSVGFLVKAFLLKKSIEQGKTIYDFLRGNERYKYDLGAQDLPLFQINKNL